MFAHKLESTRLVI